MHKVKFKVQYDRSDKYMQSQAISCIYYSVQNMYLLDPAVLKYTNLSEM